jgi:hypothetical protein
MLMAISEAEIVNFVRNKEIRVIGDRLISIPKKKEKAFFHVEMDIPEDEIDELLDDEISQWIA